MSVYRDKDGGLWVLEKVLRHLMTSKEEKFLEVASEAEILDTTRQILIQNGLDPDKDVEMVPMKGGSDGRMKAIIAGVLTGVVFPRHEKGLKDNGENLSQQLNMKYRKKVLLLIWSGAIKTKMLYTHGNMLNKS